MENSIEEKFKKDKLEFIRITNKDLVCNDCRKQFDDTNMPCNTSKCEVFNIKPSSVLDGGDCDEHEAK